MKTDLFQSSDHCWVFQICWHIECSTFTASSSRIWNSSTGIPSPPLALFVVMLPKAHLTSHFRMSGSRWVITPSWLSGSWRSFLYSSSVYSCHLFLIYLLLLLGAMAPHSSTLAWKIPWTEESGGLQSMGFAKNRTRLSTSLSLSLSVYSCHLFLISSASVRSTPFLSFTEPIFPWNVSLGISNFLEEISSVLHSIVFLYMFIQPSPKVSLPTGHSQFHHSVYLVYFILVYLWH